MKTSLLRRGRFGHQPTGPLSSTAGKWLLLVAISLLVLQKAHATLYLLEPFDYPAPEALTNVPAWSTNANGTTLEANPTMLIVPGDFSYPPLTQPTTTNSASLQWFTNTKGVRGIPGGPYGGPGSGASIYCSFEFCKATTNYTTANLPIFGLTTPSLGTLNSTTNIGGPVLNITGTNDNGNPMYMVGIKIGGGVASAVYPPSGLDYLPGNTNGTVTFGQTNFLVMKYTFSASGADTVALWVNPDSSSFGGNEPAATANDVAATNASGFTANAPAGLGFIEIRGGSGGTAGLLQIDNLMIGSTWADVTPTCNPAGTNSSPANQSVSPGQTATFTIGATGASPTFQWQTNKSNAGWISIPNATNTSYTTVPEVLGDNGLQFRCIVSVACDSTSVTSSSATLTVETCVGAATTDPTDQTINAGSTAAFSITPTGSHPTFQWQMNNTNNMSGFINISLATNASYTTPVEPVATNGLQFRCVVSVACNSSSATSAAANLTVNCNTAQVSSLQNVSVVQGQKATFSVTSSSSTPTYQWANDGGTGGVTFTNIPLATNASYTTPPTVLAQYAWMYQCTVSNACDETIASTSASLLVFCTSAGIVTDLQNTSVALGAGQTTIFAITASGSLPILYQWQTNNGAGWVNITGATNTSYTTLPFLLANTGLKYQCLVTEPCDGSTQLSSVATVSVYSDSAEFLSVNSGNIGDPNSWEQSFDGGGTFSNPALYPPADLNSTNTVVQNGFTVANAASTSLNHVVVQSGGEIMVNTNTTITLTTNGVPGTALDVSGTMDVTGKVVINTNVQAVVESGGLWETEQGSAYTINGVLTFKSGSVYEHNPTITAGTIPAATWNTGSSCQVIGITTSTATLAGVAQNFDDLVWNCPNQSSALPWGGSVPTNSGDFTMVSTGTGEVRVSNNNSPTWSIAGDLNLQGGQLTFASGTGHPVIALSGNAVLTGGVLSNSLSSTTAGVKFVKVGTQTYSNSGTTFTGTNINWTVNTNSILQPSGILGHNLILSSLGSIRLITNSGFQVTGNLTCNDNTVVADLGGAVLGNGTYPLMTYGGSLSGFFKTTPTIVNGSVTGVAFISTATTNQVNLVVAAASTPHIASFGVAGTALNLTGANGIPGDSYAVLASTNVALPLNQWTPVLLHGVFDGSGNLSTSLQLTNTLGTNSPQQYFRIQMPSP